MIHNSKKMVFFGSSDFSVYVLDELKMHNLIPKLIITTPDKPKGRKLVLTPNPCKIWAKENDIEVLDPVSLKNNNDLVYQLSSLDSELFLVASYGKIIPKEIFDIPKNKTLNIHPSLLPKYRGASPIQSQILNNEKEIGVSIMVITEGMDEGPIVAKKIIPLQEFFPPQSFERLARLTEPSTRNFSAKKYPCSQNLEAEKISNTPGRTELEKILAVEGARLFSHILPEWIQGVIDPIMQNEVEATYCKKIEKKDGEINLEDDPYQNYLKIRAFENWPTAYFFTERGGKKIRVIITDANFKDDKLEILKVIPEGKKEMLYEDFLRGKK